MTAAQPMRRTRLERLRTAIDALPRDAREAMLDGLADEQIITGAYVSGDGGVCPMVAMHRRSVRAAGETVARAWDQFCGVRAGERRFATEREVLTIKAMLNASLLEDDAVDLGAAVAEHEALRRARRSDPPRGDVVDFTAALEDHRRLARERRAREAAAVGRTWLERPAEVSSAGSPARAGHAAGRRADVHGAAPVPAYC